MEMEPVDIFDTKYYRDLEMWDREVIETGAIPKLGCDFLFAFYSNYGRL